jgi:uncharacterized membrane protein
MAHRKTLSFALIHMMVAFGVVYLMTGSWAIGGAVALIEPTINTIAYFFHEKVWERWTRPAANDALGAA